ncbi:hypothetical protein PHMEG_00011191 [Phytophthora megakarya]|uniref:Laminin IV type A domain-containing protein n=1 Tax=Phytophthora megakarya TaxID=4795 RepID=A0A225WDI6_9STRA|nr:hypothetical protein PHMEG_00011191 [Phytophthora megakarya]
MRQLKVFLLLLLCLRPVVHGAITSAKVAPLSLHAGVVSPVTVTFTSGVDVEVGGSVQVKFPTDFHISSGTKATAMTTATTLSIASLSSSHISVQVQTTKISAGLAFEFSIAEVANPGAQITSEFEISTYDSSKALLEVNSMVAGVRITATTLSSASVAPDRLDAGIKRTATVSFTSAVGLPVGSMVLVTFPSDFMLASTTLSSATNMGSSSTVATSNSVVTITINGSAVRAGTNVSFNLDGVTNPGAKTTGTFALTTTDSSSNVFEQTTAIPAVVIVSKTMSGASVIPDSRVAGVVGTATVSFTSDVELPVGSKVKVTFPGDFIVASSTLSSAINIASSSTVVTNSSVVFVTIAGSAVSMGSSVSFKLDKVTNPGAKTTGSFALATVDSSSNMFEEATAISAVLISNSTMSSATVTPDSQDAGVLGTVTISFTSAVGLPVGSMLIVTFPSDFTVASTMISSVTNIANSSTVSTSSSVATVIIAGTPVTAGASISFKLDGVVNSGAKTTGTFDLTTTDSSSNVFEQATDIDAVVISSTILTGFSVGVDSNIAGVLSSYAVAFTMNVGIPVGGYIVLAPPSNYTLSGNMTLVDPLLSISWSGIIEEGQVVKFKVISPYPAGQHNIKVDSLQNPGACTTGSFMIFTTDPNEFLLESANCSGVVIVPGSITDAVLTPQLAHPGIVSRVDISFTASAGLAMNSLLIIQLPKGDYNVAVPILSVVVVSSPSSSATGSWDSTTSSMHILITGLTTIPHGAAVVLQVTALQMPQSIRASSTVASIESWGANNLQLDDSSSMTLSAITAVQGLPCMWSTESPNPGITSNVLVTFNTNGMIPVGGTIVLQIPTSDFFADSTGGVPFVVFKFPTTVVVTSTWYSSAGVLNFVIGNDSIPAYQVGVQVKILKLDTPRSVRTMSRLPASLRTYDPLKIEIDGPSTLQMDAITRGFILGTRIWTAVNAVAGATSNQTIDFFVTGRLDPGGMFEFTLPDTQWSMAAIGVATFKSPNLGDVGAVKWDNLTRTMTVTLTGTTSIPSYSGIILLIQNVTNPPKETGVNNAYLTTRAADSSIIDGPDTVSVMTIVRGVLSGAKNWISVTTTSASMQSDQLLSFTLSGALASGSTILVTLPPGGWRVVNSASVLVSFSLPATGVTVQYADWSSAIFELRIVTAGSMNEGTPVALLVTNMVNPYSNSSPGMCRVLTTLPDSGIVAESKNISVNGITSDALPIEGLWVSGITTPGVVSTQTVSFTTGGELEAGAKFCVIIVSGWKLMPSTSVSLILARSTQSSSLTRDLNMTTSLLCMQTGVEIDQETDVTIVLTDILQPESIRPEMSVHLLIQSHLGGSVNTGSIRMNAITHGMLTGPLTWQTLFFSPGPVAGLETSAHLAFKTTGQVAAGGYIVVELPFEWVMASICVATFVHPTVLGNVSCTQNNVSIRLLNSLSEASDVNISFSGVYNPPLVMPEGVASCRIIAADGGVIDESNSIITGAITSAVTGISNSGDHLVAVVGVTKTFAFEGYSLNQSDVVKFVDGTTSNDANCGITTTGQSDVGGVSVKYLSANLDISVKFTQSSEDGQPFAICYKFGDNPFKLYSSLGIMVKEIKAVNSDVGLSGIAVVNFVKTWSFEGNGIEEGDQVRWIDLDVAQSAAYFITPPDCLDTSTLAQFSSPSSGALTAPEDDFTRVVQKDSAAPFAFSVESSGKTFCLCYKFGNEPFMVYPEIKMKVNHLQRIETASPGSEGIVVVDAPKSFKFFGDGVFLNDRLYFVELGSVSSCVESDKDKSLQLLHFINGQEESVIFIDGNLVTTVNFDATAAGLMVVPCYQFGMEPYHLYPDMRLAVNMVKRYIGTLGSAQLAVAEVPEPLTFLGYGLNVGDQVRWILHGEEDCASSLAFLTDPDTLELINTITLDATNAGIFNFTSTQEDYNPVLCYKFGEEKFKLYSEITIAIGTIRGKSSWIGAKDIAVSESRKTFTLLGTNTAEGDRVGWSTAIDSATPCSNLSLLIPNPSNTDNDYLSYLGNANTFQVAISPLTSGQRVYLCYGFGLEPLKLFTDLYLDVKSITNMRALVASPNVAIAGAIKTFLFDGDGVASGDYAKFVTSDNSDCMNPGVSLMNIIKEYDDYNEMAMYLYEISNTSTTTGIFQISDDRKSAGLGRVLCYRFGAEPFAFYENFHIDVKTIWGLHQVDVKAGGKDNVVVVNEPKRMVIDGVGMSIKDTLKFVNASADTDCADLPAEGQAQPNLQVSNDSTVTLPFNFGSKGGTWALCYKFDDESYWLYSSVTITVKEITALLDYMFQDIADLGGVATIGHEKQWKPVGSGIQKGDSVKIVSQSVTSSIDCGNDGTNIATGTSVMTVGSKLIFSGTTTAIPASTSDVYHLCYRFQDEPFSYIRDFTFKTYGITGLDHSVVLVSASTTVQVNGFRISDKDEMGWTTSTTNCSTMIDRTTVSGAKSNIRFSNSYSNLFLCYSFNHQPFDVFKTVTLSVVKAEIWTPQTISIIADQTTDIDVSGTFGITQGTDQIAWIPSDVADCSSDTIATYAHILQTSITSVTKSQSTVSHVGAASFHTKYVAPSSGNEVVATDSISTWKLCYRFGNTPNYLMFGNVVCTVLNVVEVELMSLQSTTTGAVMKFEFGGVGLQDFDSVKWVDASTASTDADCKTLPPIGGSKTSDVVSSRATFTFVQESSSLALCYMFLGHAFKLYTSVLIKDSTKSTASTGQSISGTVSTTYDEQAAAASSDEFTASRDIATVSLILDKDISEIPPGSGAETTFKISFIATLATSLRIDESRIQITNIVAGSVIVSFRLVASDNLADPTVHEVIQNLHTQLTDKNSMLRSSNTVVVKNPATALIVNLTTLPASPTSSVAIQALGYQSNGLFSFVRSIYSVTEKSGKVMIPVIRLQGTDTSITIQVQTKGITATIRQDYAFPDSMIFDSTLHIVRLRFEIGEVLQMIELDLLDNTVKGVHFKSLSLVLLEPREPRASLGVTKEALVRIYDYGDAVPLVKSSFTISNEEPNGQKDNLQGWKVVANGVSPLRIDANGVFAIDDVFGEAEYNQKCDLAAPSGVCTYACDFGGGLTTSDRLNSTYNVLSLDGDDYTASMNGISSFPTEAFTITLWVKTAQTNSDACLYSYSASSANIPTVALTLCNPSNLQLFINADSNVNGLSTFVNISDNTWHFLAVTWQSEDGQARVYDNGMLVFDGGPYREGTTIESNGYFVAGNLVLSNASAAPCRAEISLSTTNVNCDVVVGSGLKGQIQHVHVWSRVLARSELLGELSWPLRVVRNGLILGWNFDASYLLMQGRVVNDLSIQSEEQKNPGVIHCSTHEQNMLQLASSSFCTSISSCLLPGEIPRLDSAFPCGPVFANIWQFSAPVQFTSKLKNAYGGRLQFRLLAPSFNGSPRPRRGQLSIFSTSNTGAQSQMSVALGSFDLPSALSWTYYSVVLREDFGWISEPNGTSLSSAQFQTLLHDATTLLIRGDMWGYDSTGSGQEAVYLNDVALYAR